MFFVFAALLLACVCHATPSEETVVAVLQKYEVSQNKKDLSIIAQVFNANATLHLPAGSGSPTVGLPNILKVFDSFFKSLTFLHEDFVSPILVHGNVGAYHKRLIAGVPNKDCVVSVSVVQYFTVGDDGLIWDCRTVWNTTDYNIQYNCASKK